METPFHLHLDRPRLEATAALRPVDPGPPVTPVTQATRVGAGVVFFAALLVIVYAYRRLQARARLEEAEAILDAALLDDARDRREAPAGERTAVPRSRGDRAG